jgi:hypothetical protein
VTNGNNCITKDTAYVDILPLPAKPTATGDQFCGPSFLNLTASGCAGQITWFDTQFGSNIEATGTTFTTPVLTENTNYFVSCTDVKGCESAIRTVVKGTISEIPNIELIAVDPTCNGSNGLANGKILINKSKATEVYSWNLETPYGATTVTPFESIPLTGVLISGISTPLKNVDYRYSVRVKNADGCFTDKSTFLVKNCDECEREFCPPANAVGTK